MKRLLFLLGLIFFCQFTNSVFAIEDNIETRKVFSENLFFGLKDENDNVVVKPEYRKLIKIGTNSWIAQHKKMKYGLIDNNGNVLVPIKYNHTDRILGKYAKFGNDNDYGVYDEYGDVIIPPIYSGIEFLSQNMFLTYKNYRYGVSDFQGNMLLANLYEDIYMPQKNTMRILYHGNWYEIQNATSENLILPSDLSDVRTADNLKITDMMVNTGLLSGYSLLTASDYILKIFSSISPAHEGTIDELMFSHGADTVNILIKMVWLPKYPYTFAKHYYRNMRIPNNGPLSDLRYDLINQMK